MGSITSAPVTLAIAQPPAITVQPQGLTVLAGTAVTFSVTNTGDGPFTYLWRFNGSDYSTTTSNSLRVTAGFYQNGLWSVEVGNAVGVATSSTPFAYAKFPCGLASGCPITLPSISESV